MSESLIYGVEKSFSVIAAPSMNCYSGQRRDTRKVEKVKFVNFSVIFIVFLKKIFWAFYVTDCRNILNFALVRAIVIFKSQVRYTFGTREIKTVLTFLATCLALFQRWMLRQVLETWNFIGSTPFDCPGNPLKDI